MNPEPCSEARADLLLSAALGCGVTLPQDTISLGSFFFFFLVFVCLFACWFLFFFFLILSNSPPALAYFNTFSSTLPNYLPQSNNKKSKAV